MLFQIVREYMFWYLFWIVVGLIDFNIVVGQFLGALLSFGVGLLLAKREYDRRMRQKRENWKYRLHTSIYRLKQKNSLHMENSSERQKGQLTDKNERYTDRIEGLIIEAPSEVDELLYEAIDHMHFEAERYNYEYYPIDEDGSDIDRFKRDNALEHYRKQVWQFSLVALYILEEKEGENANYTLQRREKEVARMKMKSMISRVSYIDSEDVEKKYGLEEVEVDIK